MYNSTVLLKTVITTIAMCEEMLIAGHSGCNTGQMLDVINLKIRIDVIA